jgi:hypothetical protein
MKHNQLWNGGGREIEVERLGKCMLWWRLVNGEFYQFKIKHGFTTVIGEQSYRNIEALDSAFQELKKKFKSILN